MTDIKNIKTNKQKEITIIGARLHNLKNISVSIPHNKFTIITGVSGSGKSTLAFDTIYAEGQRRFVESLSSYARQFLERMHKPDVDSITGIPPAIAIEQKQHSKNPRSTVGTSTEIYDYFRLLYGRIGITICKNCGKPVVKDNAQTVTETILKMNVGDKVYIMFSLPPQTRNSSQQLDEISKLGFSRIILKDSDEILDIHENNIPKKTPVEDIFVLADRILVENNKEMESRLTDSLETAFRAGNGRIIVKNLTANKICNFSTQYECADCEIVYTEPEPRLFSFNNPFGACPSCQGFGRTIGIDENLVFPEKTRSINKGVIHPFRTPGFSQYQRALLRIAPKYKLPLDLPYENLSEENKSLIWNGAEDYIGIKGFFKMLEEKNYKLHYRVMLSRYRGYTECKACGGSRLRTTARQVYIGGKSIPDLIKMPLSELFEHINTLRLNNYQQSVASQVVREIIWRLKLLVDIGLHYLTLDRLTHTLSGGESQRINLSTALGSALVGTLYVLDEPSIGLHPRDTSRLLGILEKLRNLGNTIIVVEHDPEIISKADYIVDLGPKAGDLGGELIYSGNLEGINSVSNSQTGLYLSGKQKIKIPEKRRNGISKSISIYKPRKHNLSMDKVSIPLGCMVSVTGVSGSGKSTFVHDILYAGLKKIHGGYDGESGFYEKFEGGENIEFIELVDQSQIGKSSRSTPATYTKVFDLIRDLFASTQAARQLDLKPGYFSFNVPGGRCEVCEGEGSVTVDMQFLPDVHLECEACKGSRYKKEARSILFKEKSIVDVLNMTIDEALSFFKDHKKIHNKLSTLQNVGLGYLKLGQPSTMLSGGESQRIKLSAHLESDTTAHTLFIFDEPTTGLHLADISKLIKCFNQLIEHGHSVVIIEHNLHIIASSDWVIDLGPEAGEKGGKVVAAGTPEKIATVKNSFTGQALKEFLNIQ